MSKLLDLWADMTGVVLDYALNTPPSAAWMMCYGQALLPSDTAAARLRAKLLADGSPYGTDGNGNPLVPDVRGRTTAGKDDMGGVAANRLTAAGAGIDGKVLGAAGGSETHALTTAQLAAHNHGVTDPGHNHGVTDPGHGHGVYDPGHAHATQTMVGTGGYGLANNTQVTGAVGYGDRVVVTGGSGSPGSAGAGTGVSIYGAGTGVSIQSKATGISTQNNGSGNAHNNTQPTAVMNKIIKL